MRAGRDFAENHFVAFHEQFDAEYAETAKRIGYGAGDATGFFESRGAHRLRLPGLDEKGFTGYNGRLDKRSTGIGLYLCRQVLGHLGIKIRAESQVGCGTRMRLTIPKPYKTVR